MNQTMTIFFALMRYALCGTPLSAEICENVTPDVLAKLYAVSTRFDLVHIAADALRESGLSDISPDIARKFNKAKLLAVYRYEQQRYALERIKDVLGRAEIPYIPLKGAVLRAYYPEPWMRTSCDIDVLMGKEDVDRAAKLIEDELGFRADKRASHDISLYSPAGVHLELHFDTVEKNRAVNANAVLRRIWDYAYPAGGPCQYALSSEMLYFYHIAHMAKHIENGGCGIRPFIDLWIMNRRFCFDADVRDALLREGGLFRFTEACAHLAAVWMADAAPDETSKKLERYILRGGVYGSMENMVEMRRQKNGGGAGYLKSRLIVPYDTLKNFYPVLDRHKWLTPAMEVRRWGRVFLSGRMRRSVRELGILRRSSETDDVGELLRELGI